jgi:hypothetical protein
MVPEPPPEPEFVKFQEEKSPSKKYTCALRICLPESISMQAVKTVGSNLEAGLLRLADSEWQRKAINSLEKLALSFFSGKPCGQGSLDHCPRRIKRPHAHHEPFLS